MAEKLSGIYAIKNAQTGDIYIGSSGNVHRRWHSHRHQLRRGKHHSPKLQRAWRKYGEDAFRFEVMEVVSDTSELYAREQHWLDALKPLAHEGGYNMHPVAESARGHKLSQAARDAMSASRTGRKMPPRSAEHRAKLAKAASGRKGMRWSETTLAKMRSALALRNKSEAMRAVTARRNKSEAMRQVTAERNRSEAMREVVRRPKSEAHRLAMCGPLSEAHRQALRVPKSEAHRQAMRGPKSAEHAEKLRAILARARTKKL